MIQKIYTGNAAMTLKVSVTTTSPQDIRIMVEDSDQEDTVLTDRVKSINGSFDFYVRMPLCRKYVNLYLTNDADGTDNGFTYNGFEKMHLERRLAEIDFSTYHLREFIKFYQKFCYNAGVLRVNDPGNDNDFYRSNGWHFFIKYLPVIIDYKTGAELTTPCRVAENGLIEISQKYFLNYTVPMRFAVGCHEYSHPFANEDPDDESEADLNGLTIYLGLGYPRIEANEAWGEVFEANPSDQNVERQEIIQQFITDFESKKMVMW